MKMQNRIKKILLYLKNNILGVFIFFALLMVILGTIYYYCINPNKNEIAGIINKFTVGDYSIPYYVAERYLTWIRMRTFFFSLNYILTLLGIIASLMTVFYASWNAKNNSEKHNRYIVFLSLLSTCFTIANIFINSGSKANMSQHAWRELDSCIMETIIADTLTSEEKDIIIIKKIIELEKYIETYEK